MPFREWNFGFREWNFEFRELLREYPGTPPQWTAKGASGKGPRQKTSKIVKKCRKYFRHFSTIFTQGKKRQKSSKNLKIIFDNFEIFRAAPVFRPTLGGSDLRELREWPFHSESVFPEIGVVPRLPIFGTVENRLQMWHPELPEMKVEVVAFALLIKTCWTFRIFFIFFCSGAQEREEASEEVAGVYKNRRRGGGSEGEAREGEGRRGNVQLWGGGGEAKYFFGGRNAHQEKVSQ